MDSHFASETVNCSLATTGNLIGHNSLNGPLSSPTKTARTVAKVTSYFPGRSNEYASPSKNCCSKCSPGLRTIDGITAETSHVYVSALKGELLSFSQG